MMVINNRQHHNEVSTMPAIERRKIMKPILEKKRRDRINRSLCELKSLILALTNKEESYGAKMEKADILEMTATYLKSLNIASMGSSFPSSTHMERSTSSTDTISEEDQEGACEYDDINMMDSLLLYGRSGGSEGSDHSRNQFLKNPNGGSTSDLSCYSTDDESLPTKVMTVTPPQPCQGSTVLSQRMLLDKMTNTMAKRSPRSPYSFTEEPLSPTRAASLVGRTKDAAEAAASLLLLPHANHAKGAGFVGQPYFITQLQHMYASYANGTPIDDQTVWRPW